MLNELRLSLEGLGTKLDELRGYLDLARNRKKIEDLEKELNEPGIWKNQEKANNLSGQLQALRSIIGPYNKIKEQFDSVNELAEIVEPDDDGSIRSLNDEIEDIRVGLKKLEFKSLLGGRLDRCGAILSVNAGAGGTESCDWASMILRMYLRWAEEHKHQVDVLDQLSGEEAGLKNATFIIRGDFAYGYLRSEIGVHRLVRVSPFDSNKRRHTSFASVDVIPEIDSGIKVDINESDLRIDTYRSSGAGGQHVNVTDSAVRITHVPTGIVVQCQKERSQHKNKATAMKVLKARLYDREKKKQEAETMKSYDGKKRIEWGSQIRSYVLHPYKMVKDHRTGSETSSAERVLDGELDDFMEAYLKWSARK
ncbi:MAG: peptide chain release factor 2 [Candidatus Omnitrophica bacterium]|nr:peptide chain release factor 2 [Candidatus Omnitrophota bacterium]MBU1784166.1 peptide chain release factor 2 [Candidatus Omnitrophota bacterium]